MTETPAKCMSKLDWHAIVRCTLNFFRVMFLDKTPSHSWASRSPSPSSGRGLCPCFPKPAMTVWVRSAETDLVLLSTPMSRVTDNSGLTDCSIITRWQKKQRDDSVIYVLNCFSSLRPPQSFPNVPNVLQNMACSAVSRYCPLMLKFKATGSERANEWGIWLTWAHQACSNNNSVTCEWPLRGGCYTSYRCTRDWEEGFVNK